MLRIILCFSPAIRLPIQFVHIAYVYLILGRLHHARLVMATQLFFLCVLCWAYPFRLLPWRLATPMFACRRFHLLLFPLPFLFLPLLSLRSLPTFHFLSLLLLLCRLLLFLGWSPVRFRVRSLLMSIGLSLPRSLLVPLISSLGRSLSLPLLLSFGLSLPRSSHRSLRLLLVLVR